MRQLTSERQRATAAQRGGGAGPRLHLRGPCGWTMALGQPEGMSAERLYDGTDWECPNCRPRAKAAPGISRWSHLSTAPTRLLRCSATFSAASHSSLSIASTSWGQASVLKQPNTQYLTSPLLVNGSPTHHKKKAIPPGRTLIMLTLASLTGTRGEGDNFTGEGGHLCLQGGRHM